MTDTDFVCANDVSKRGNRLAKCTYFGSRDARVAVWFGERKTCCLDRMLLLN